MIIGLAIDLLYLIDIQADKAVGTAYSMHEEFVKQSINRGNILNNTVLHNNNLYFIAYDQGVFGIIDTITKKIEYVSDPIEISSKNGFPPQLKEIQVSDDKVYVLASDNVLHIFEKEMIESLRHIAILFVFLTRSTR